MTVHGLHLQDGALPRSAMARVVIDTMTATRNNIDALRADETFADSVVDAATLLAEALRAEQKVLVCGNGGSLCDAMHFAEELSGNFRLPRPALSAIALADAAHLTAVGNDFSYDQVFARGVEAHGRCGDVLVTLSTSGNSPNVLAAVQRAKEKRISTIGLVGRADSPLAAAVDVPIVTGTQTKWADRVQELHIIVIHTLIELVEATLFESDQAEMHLA
ncbi:SIS domain-containing protein [Mycobacterium sp. M1]|uniref:SIS domain-containing protein n=1 Tax=Mycolicibacter acidiphilus TaxID=2835306 RepID=A0ABS5RGV4_9MYCO|nr:SIS domain-containing protein [Mycolicibacter acidiphilus]MBS9533510.1 SIS domain-containing protein [Mycolicibacter acidiphilus]